MSRCAACDRSCRFVRPTGPTPCDYLMIGEKPGQTEDRVGFVFKGDTGRELDDTYLPLARLERSNVRVTNAVKCRLGGNNNKPTDAQILTCARHHLPSEVTDCAPSIIFLMGATACSLVPDIELDKEHGIPHMIEDHEIFGGWSGWVVPMYHPAAGLHETSKMTPLLDDFREVGCWLRGKRRPLPTYSTDYSICHTQLDIFRAFHGGSVYKFLPIDTESDGARPWSLQFSTKPGNGFLIYAHRKDLIDYFVRLTYSDGLLLHNAVYDLGVLEAIGIPLHLRSIRDTMQEAYHLGNLPQGLKALGFRLLGLRMRDYSDVVMPHSRRKMIDWLTSAWIDASENRDRVEIKLKTKVKSLLKPTKRERDLRRILSHSHKPDYDLWEKADEAGLSGFPSPSIAHVPESEAIAYACEDAMVTGLVGQWMDGERERIVREEWCVSEEDRDQ